MLLLRHMEEVRLTGSHARSQNLAGSNLMKIPPFRIERYFAEYEFNVPYLLCGSDCEAISVKDLLALEPGAETALKNLNLGYTETRGAPELRQEIARLYTKLDAEHILVHSGGEEAIFAFMNALLAPGDHVIIHYPVYQSLFQVAASLGCKVTRWQASEKENWRLDFDFLEDNLQPQTKAVVVNCPHNPTGYLMSKEEFARLHELSNKHGFIVLSDEIYRLLEHDEADRLPAACDVSSRAVSLGGLSKAFGLPGLRIGWLATQNNDLLRKVETFKDYLTICTSAPSESLATVAVRNYETLTLRSTELIKTNLPLLDRFFKRHADVFNWKPPEAGPIAFPSLKNEQSADAFSRQLVQEKGVLLLPGTIYDSEYHSNFRIAFGRQNMPQCLQVFETFLA